MILAQASGTGGGVIGLGVTGFLVGDGDIGEGSRGAPTSPPGGLAGCGLGYQLQLDMDK